MMTGSAPSRTRKYPSAVRSPVQNARSRGSISDVSSVALSASVRATMRVGMSNTSAARRAALSTRMKCCVGTRTFPPRCPHFFSAASWSSKCTPAAPASIIAFISSKAWSTPPNPASASARIGAYQSVAGADPSRRPPPPPPPPPPPSPPSPCSPLGPLDLVGSQQRVVQAPDQRRHAVAWIQALVGVGLAGQIRVGGHLPSGEVDGLESCLDHLHRLRSGEGAERGDVGLML